MKKLILALGIGLLGLGLLTACPVRQPGVSASTTVTGTAGAGEQPASIVNVPMNFNAHGGFTNPICRVDVEVLVDGTNLVMQPEGQVLVNLSPFVSANCSVGNAHYPPVLGNYHKRFEVDCGSTPIPFGSNLGELWVRTYEDTVAGSYPIDITLATSYRCSDGLPTDVATKMVDGLITVNP